MASFKEGLDNTLTGIGNALPAFGGSTNANKAKMEAAKKAQCEAAGGVWDGVKCVFPKKDTTAKVDTAKTTNNDQVFRNADNGNISGVTIDGKTYLGLNPAQVESMLAAKQAREQGGQATQQFEQQALLQKKQAQEQQALQQAQGQVQTGIPQVTEADILKAVPQETALEGMATTGGAVTGGLAGAAVGTKLGTLAAPFTGGASIPIGAVVGAVAGAIGGAYAKISYDKRQDVKQATKVAKTANTNFGQTIDALNAGLISHEEALKRFNDDKISLYAAHANLKRDTTTNLDRFLSGGADELVQVEDYIRDLETIYQTEFLLAYSAPNPKNIKYLNVNSGTEE